jgi:hypothetical protein
MERRSFNRELVPELVSQKGVIYKKREKVKIPYILALSNLRKLILFVLMNLKHINVKLMKEI